MLTIGTAEVAAAGAVLDGAPDDLGRRGSVVTVDSTACTAGGSKSGLVGTGSFGGSLGLGLLLPFAVLSALRRRKR